MRTHIASFGTKYRRGLGDYREEKDGEQDRHGEKQRQVGTPRWRAEELSQRTAVPAGPDSGAGRALSPSGIRAGSLLRALLWDRDL